VVDIIESLARGRVWTRPIGPRNVLPQDTIIVVIVIVGRWWRQQRQGRHRPARVVDSRAMAVRHFTHVVANSLPSTALRLFVMRERDEFTSMDQLECMVKRMRGDEGVNGGGVVNVEIGPGGGHFDLESPGYDKLVARTVLDWLDKIPA
jgi:hypothetical protein